MVDLFALFVSGVVQVVNAAIERFPLVDEWLDRFEVFACFGGLLDEGCLSGALFVVGLKVGLLLVVGKGGKVVELFAGEASGYFSLAVGCFGQLG